MLNSYTLLRMRGEDSEAEGGGGLADPFAGNFGYQLRRASAMVMAEFGEALAALDLRVAEASVLLVIDLNPGATQSEVGKLLGIQRANMAPLVTALEAKGLLVRADTDGRAQPLSVTAEGKAMAARVRAIAEAQERRIAAAIDAEGLAALTLALRRLRGTG